MVAQGVTAVVSTAYMDEAERFDRVALLHRGRLLAVDTPEALMDGLAGRVLALRTGNLRAAQQAAGRLAGVRAAAVFGERLHVILVPDGAGSAQVASALAPALAAAGIEVLEQAAIAASMEDVFIDHVVRGGEA